MREQQLKHNLPVWMGLVSKALTQEAEEKGLKGYEINLKVNSGDEGFYPGGYLSIILSLFILTEGNSKPERVSARVVLTFQMVDSATFVGDLFKQTARDLVKRVLDFNKC